ncbi:leucine-rich repeat protein [Mycoplasma sp. OR1901]|uniref:leucine-rich repeat protein n=1 Tax=Mycoplasma sp. OR1901 TaxID=2742195 RepID=UPI001583D970|nr:leucine-rich repeat domain-containing protein [Mycoplasma sp. OR1901]QKT05400.1 leucine-rich repeat protein [Mycoplasma sp. OR1901]
MIKNKWIILVGALLPFTMLSTVTCSNNEPKGVKEENEKVNEIKDKKEIENGIEYLIIDKDNIQNYINNGSLIKSEKGYSLIKLINNSIKWTLEDNLLIPSNLEIVNLNMPNIVKIIDSAFKGSKTLKSIILPKAIEICNESFKDNSALVDVNIPLVTKIGDLAFANDVSLETLDLPKLNQIGLGSFDNTIFINSLINYSENKLAIINNILVNGKYARGEIILPNTITKIAERAFINNYALKSIQMPSVIEVGNDAFKGAHALSKISIPNVIKIGTNGFHRTALVTVDAPKVTAIGDYSFSNNMKLNNVKMPNLTKVGSYAFGGTSFLQSLINSNENKLAILNDNIILNGFEAKGYIIIPDSITIIADSAFEVNRSITRIKMPNVTHIGNFAFASNRSLLSINIPKVIEIGESAFSDSNNISFENSTLPSNMSENDFNSVKEGKNWNNN